MKHADIQKLHDAGLITDEQRQKIIEQFQFKEDGGGKFLAIVSLIGAVSKSPPDFCSCSARTPAAGGCPPFAAALLRRTGAKSMEIIARPAKRCSSSVRACS
jgi:hypothetical protein